MEELLKLLGLGADGDVFKAVQGLMAQVTTLTTERDTIQAKLTVAEAKGTEVLTQRTAEVETLHMKVSAYETEMQRLAGEVSTLTEARKARDREDRINLALRKGKIAPAELTGDDNVYRKLAAEQPETFDRLMALRPERSDLFQDTGGDQGGEPPVAGSAEEAMDALFAESERVAQEQKIEFEAARAQVLTAHPEWKKLTEKEGD